jgi:hypothetical protein
VDPIKPRTIGTQRNHLRVPVAGLIVVAPGLDPIVWHILGWRKLSWIGFENGRWIKKRERFVMIRQEFPAFVELEIAVIANAFQRFFWKMRKRRIQRFGDPCERQK